MLALALLRKKFAADQRRSQLSQRKDNVHSYHPSISGYLVTTYDDKIEKGNSKNVRC